MREAPGPAPARPPQNAHRHQLLRVPVHAAGHQGAAGERLREAAEGAEDGGRVAGEARGAPVQAAGAERADADHLLPHPPLRAEAAGAGREAGRGHRRVGHRPGTGLFLRFALIFLYLLLCLADRPAF